MSRIPFPTAPGADDHPSLALVNSAVTLPGGHEADELGSPAEATAWLVGHRLVPAETTLLAYCQGQLTTLRGNLRAIFTARVAGTAPEPEAVEGVNRALVKVPSALLLHFDDDSGLHRVPRHPVTQLVEHAMAQIAEDAAALLTGGQAGMVAQCESEPCDRFFLRTHARRCWCSTRCGDRVRAARAYARKLERAQAG
ncbi:CGNR zinc finger domain-containing protein [Paeniglutamicibacter psychrophenolicus]|uniref:RNA-binding Zn ribbon-like protein n=2 Tax=Paeniglutamicibacter psychrophenolicus TaxID=257454 RepID=A0ABS4W902_9MICC|nr:putative RNA-binding Zn ribbon-like protein [Paeniglutamicibacter psychrophenolicus]